MKGYITINQVNTVLCDVTGKYRDMVNFKILYDDEQMITGNLKVEQKSREVSCIDIHEALSNYFKGELQFK
ncbi:hypothetical protein [Halalkalibacter oceani]|uniref:hypothetical protein n=1 Tax=Halalkalibacter oceani TaxID=1653776 RepID=UPI003391857B